MMEFVLIYKCKETKHTTKEDEMYELVMVWEDGDKEIHSYKNREEAENGKRNMEMAFGAQVWCCVREKKS